MFIDKTKVFDRWARKNRILDSSLMLVVTEVRQGLFDADLGGNIIKKRIAVSGKGKRGSARSIIVTNKIDKYFFVYGYRKNEKESIGQDELLAFKKLAADLLELSIMDLQKAKLKRVLIEIV